MYNKCKQHILGNIFLEIVSFASVLVCGYAWLLRKYTLNTIFSSVFILKCACTWICNVASPSKVIGLHKHYSLLLKKLPQGKTYTFFSLGCLFFFFLKQHLYFFAKHIHNDLEIFTHFSELRRLLTCMSHSFFSEMSLELVPYDCFNSFI